MGGIDEASPICEIRDGDELLALIVRREFSAPGVNFLTSRDLSQQLAYMAHPAGHIIKPHVHNSVPRQVSYSQEVLVLRKGKLRVDFYRRDTSYLRSCMLGAGDLILLAGGGHGFEVLEDLEMYEIKQGPYAGDADKSRFAGIESKERVV